MDLSLHVLETIGDGLEGVEYLDPPCEEVEPVELWRDDFHSFEHLVVTEPLFSDLVVEPDLFRLTSRGLDCHLGLRVVTLFDGVTTSPALSCRFGPIGPDHKTLVLVEWNARSDS